MSRRPEWRDATSKSSQEYAYSENETTRRLAARSAARPTSAGAAARKRPGTGSGSMSDIVLALSAASDKISALEERLCASEAKHQELLTQLAAAEGRAAAAEARAENAERAIANLTGSSRGTDLTACAARLANVLENEEIRAALQTIM